jgi:hypothetical protein
MKAFRIEFLQTINNAGRRQKGKIMKTRFIGFKVTHKWGKTRVHKAHYRHYRTK